MQSECLHFCYFAVSVSRFILAMYSVRSFCMCSSNACLAFKNSQFLNAFFQNLYTKSQFFVSRADSQRVLFRSSNHMGVGGSSHYQLVDLMSRALNVVFNLCTSFSHYKKYITILLFSLNFCTLACIFASLNTLISVFYLSCIRDHKIQQQLKRMGVGASSEDDQIHSGRCLQLD